jgi:universal stress protein E
MSSPLRSILAATDLGSASDAVVSSAALLAARSGAELHLLHTLDLSWLPPEASAESAGLEEQVREAEERLRSQVERTLSAGLRPASQRVVLRVAHRVILDRAKEVRADLIVVGPHRGGAVGAHFLGTTADRVIRTAEVPCLVVAEPLSGPVRRIGVPLDCSDPSQGALEIAFAWGLQLGGGADAGGGGAPEIRVMHVGWPVERADNPDMEDKDLRPALERQVERALSRVPEAKALDLQIEVLWANNPTEATLHWVHKREIDLLVMGTHGTSGVKRALIGSMASSVARRSPRPVILVPPALWSGAE